MMKQNLMPVGSVIRIKQMNLLVVGIDLVEQGNKFVNKYIVVPYPAGYLDKDSLCLVNVDDAEPVFQGYYPNLAKAFLEYIAYIQDVSDKIGADKIIQELNKQDSDISDDSITLIKENNNVQTSDNNQHNNAEELYPLGTVVTIEGKPYEITIIGYYVQGTDGNVHTYLGVNASHGLSVRNESVLFDAGAVGTVIFNGYDNEKNNDFRQRLLKMVQDHPLMMMSE